MASTPSLPLDLSPNFFLDDDELTLLKPSLMLDSLLRSSDNFLFFWRDEARFLRPPDTYIMSPLELVTLRSNIQTYTHNNNKSASDLLSVLRRQLENCIGFLQFRNLDPVGC